MDFKNDHEYREKIIKRFLQEEMGLIYFEREQMDGLRYLRYREIARPLIVKDKIHMSLGQLQIHYGMTRGQITRLLKTYQNESSNST